MEQYDSDGLFDADCLLEWLQIHGDKSVEEIFNIRIGNVQFTRLGNTHYEPDRMEFKCYANVKYKTNPKKLPRPSLGLDPM
jgi:hypothetical protein